MLGYVMPDKPELKVREYELYSAYYCGICKSVKQRYGQLASMVLSYDFVFLALVLSGLTSDKEHIKLERCPVHPLKKRSIVFDEEAIDYASDMMLLLTYFKLLDDRRDENSKKAKAGLILLRRTFKKIMKNNREKCIMIQEKLNKLTDLENENCASLDRAAEPFSELMGEVFAAGTITSDQVALSHLRRIGYHIGKWIYLIDAYDDIEENLLDETYNPLLLQWNYIPEEESTEGFKNRIKDRIEFNLLFYLAELSKTWNDLEVLRNCDLVENIIYSGLLRKTEEILRKGNTKDAKPLSGIGNKRRSQC